MKKKVLEYIAIFEKETKGGFSVWVPKLPGCASQGETFEEALSNIKEAIELYVESNTDKQILSTNDKKQFTVPVQIYA